MTPYDKPATFPTPYIPQPQVARGTEIPDPFSNLGGVPGGRPQMPLTGGGGGTVPVGVTAAIPPHPWKIEVLNVYDSITSAWVSATAQIRSGSVVYQSYGNFTDLHTVTNIGSVWTPIHGDYRYLVGAVNSSNNITGITLTQGASIPARNTWSGLVQSAFAVVIGRFIQLLDNSFTAEAWQVGQLTAVTLCVLDLGTGKQTKYLV